MSGDSTQAHAVEREASCRDPYRCRLLHGVHERLEGGKHQDFFVGTTAIMADVGHRDAESAQFGVGVACWQESVVGAHTHIDGSGWCLVDPQHLEDPHAQCHQARVTVGKSRCGQTAQRPVLHPSLEGKWNRTPQVEADRGRDEVGIRPTPKTWILLQRPRSFVGGRGAVDVVGSEIDCSRIVEPGQLLIFGDQQVEVRIIKD